MNGTDRMLIERWMARRDAHAFAEIVSRHSAMVYGTCLRILKNPSEAEDVAQDCFLKLATTNSTINSSLVGWLHKLATRRSLDHIRAAKRRQRREERFAGSTASAVEPTWDDIQDYVDQAVAELPDKLRAPIIAHFLEGQTYDTIAARLDIPRTTVASRLHRGVGEVRKSLQNKGITIGAVALAALITANTAYATPATLTAALGKLALAGTGGSGIAAAAASKLAVTGGVSVMTKKIVGAAAAIALAVLLGYVLIQRLGTEDAIEQTSTAPPTDTRPTVSPDVTETTLVGLAETGQESPEIVGATDVAEQPDEKEQEAPLLASISGHVTDQDSNPIKNARIWLAYEGGEGRALTDADGAYEIVGIKPVPRANVWCRAEGHEFLFSSVRLKAGAQRNNVDFVLERAAFFVAGKVVAENGRPIPGATVRVPYFAYDEEGLEETATTGMTTGHVIGNAEPFLFATTDAKGYFTVGIPDEGLCDLMVSKEGYGESFFPGIPTGTEDARLVLRSAGGIAGKVTWPDGKPVEGARIEIIGLVLPGGLEPSDVIIQEMPTERTVVFTDAEGRYLAEPLGEDWLYALSVTEIAGKEKETEPIPFVIRDGNTISYGGRPALAERSGIAVQAGRITRGVDLVIESAAEAAKVYGRVTDPHGNPVFPMTVYAYVWDPDGDLEEPPWQFGASSRTEPDGTYELRLGLAQTYSVRIVCRYMTEGGSSWEHSEEGALAAVIDLGPGDEKKVNLTVEAPLIVPVRYVDMRGNPVEGIAAAIRQAGRFGGCGGALISDAEGRVTFHGIPADLTYEALAWLAIQGELITVGVSEPFTGRSGQTVPEVRVVCHGLGGIEGVITGVDGAPLGDAEVRAWVTLWDERGAAGLRISTDENGAFYRTGALPAGVHQRVAVSFRDRESGQTYSQTIETLEIVENSVTDLGVIRLKPESPEEKTE